MLVTHGVFVNSRAAVEKQARLRDLLDDNGRVTDLEAFVRELLEWPAGFVAGLPGGREVPDSLTVALPVTGAGRRRWERLEPAARLARIDFVARDAANRDLGRRGEEFVLEFERRRLHDVERRRDLAEKVVWIARDLGDGAGYDIRSFDGDGSPRLVEVKTTGLGKYFPFNVSVNEVRCSEAVPHQFHLYRVFRFGERPRLYLLPGALTKSCSLDATQFRAYVQAPGA